MKRELQREGRREQPTLPVPRRLDYEQPSAYLKGRPDDEVILDVLGMVEFVLIPKDLHRREGLRVYFVRDREGFWHWAHRPHPKVKVDDPRGPEMWVHNRAYVAPSAMVAFYFHEKENALHEAKLADRPGREPERVRHLADAARYAALIEEEMRRP